jgi:predicted dehydrogenase/nucleoside-diphosphate-sugar epimerase
MKVGIVGAGEIAAYHVDFTKEIHDVKIVGICDRNSEKAEKLATRSGIKKSYDNIEKMLKYSKADVVHILTPPKTHAALAIQAMNAGCHVLVEKPMAINVAEAEEMVEVAKKNNVQLSICHMYLFDPIIEKLIKMDVMGNFGKIRYTESYWFSDISQGLSDAYKLGSHKTGWAFDLPGGVFANFLDHPVYLQHKFLKKITEVYVSIKRMGDNPFVAYDEIRIQLEGSRANGIIVSSLNIKPRLNVFRIYGTQSVAYADMANMTLTTQPVKKLPRMLNKAFLNFNQSRQLLTDTFASSFNILSGKIRARQGLRAFLNNFYDSLLSNDSVPISSEEGLEVTKVLSKIWEQAEKKCQTKKWIVTEGARPVYIEANGYNHTQDVYYGEEQKKRKKFLITGANGFIGKNLIARLLNLDVDIRIFVRKINRFHLESDRIEVIYGDIRDSDALEYAVKGTDIIYHMAGVVSNKGKWQDFLESNINSTRKLLELALQENISRFIYLSSVVVYGFKKINGRDKIKESDAYGKVIRKYHFYTKSKIEAEKIVFDYFQRFNLPVVVIRPGVIYGPHGSNIFQKKSMIFANANVFSPYTYVENLVDALILSSEKENAIGNAFTIVDDNLINCRQFLKKAYEISGSKLSAVFFPISILFLIAKLFEFDAKRKNSEFSPPISMASIDILQRNLIYDNKKAKDTLGWKPKISLDEALKRTYKWFEIAK